MLVTFGSSDLPHVDVEIQGKSYCVLLNLSTIVPMALHKDILSSVEKKPHGTIKFMDEQANIIEYPTFLVKEIKIGSLIINDVIIAEGSDELNDERRVGEIGMPLLSKNNLIFDLPRSTIIACNSKYKLKKIGYNLENMIQIPFEMENTAGGITFPVSSDLGIKTLALSTGFTLTSIKSSLINENEVQNDDFGAMFISSTFVMGGKNWGSQKLYLRDLPEEMQQFNGAIGMDFLSQHIFYIDFRNKIVYIGDKY